jgi:hypothetical protein
MLPKVRCGVLVSGARDHSHIEHEDVRFGPPRRIWVFDPHGDLAERHYAWMPESRKSDLIYLNVPDPEQPFGFNPLEKVPPLWRSLAANGIVKTLKKLFDDAWGIRLEYILRNALLLLLEQPEATLSDVVRLFHDKDFRKEAEERIENEQVKRFWQTEFEENKLGSLLVDPFVSRILTVPKSTFDPREAIDSGKVLLVNLAKGKIGEAPAMLFGGLLVTMLGLAGLSRADTPQEVRPFFMYLDEFQTFTTLALVNMLAWRSPTPRSPSSVCARIVLKSATATRT